MNKVIHVDGPDKFIKYFLEIYDIVRTVYPDNHCSVEKIEYCKVVANKKYKEHLKSMKKLYKIGGWTCLLVGLGCLWGVGAVAIFSGLTLFWFGATIDDAKCY
jgi:hypothetical protein